MFADVETYLGKTVIFQPKAKCTICARFYPISPSNRKRSSTVWSSGKSLKTMGVVMTCEVRKRSSIDEMLALVSMAEGVGARHEKTPAPNLGGGYQNNCNTSELPVRGGWRDPRIFELEEMGLSDLWLSIADEIGVDAFYRMWRILDSNNDAGAVTNKKLLVPRFTTFVRYQRDKLIKYLAKQGHSKKEIQQILKRQFSIEISGRSLCRIISEN